MSNPFKDATTKAVYYPDELPDVGTVRLESEAPVPAEDVPEDDAKHGDFVKVTRGTADGDGTEVWLAAPRDLVRALGEAEAEPGHLFQVRSADRGDRAHDPWKFKVAHDPEHH